MPHIHEKIDFTAEVFLVYKNKVLLRKHDKYNKWLAVGGHIELDEDPPQAAIREVKEEVGIDISLGHPEQSWDTDESRDILPPVYINRHFIEKGNPHEHVCFIYFAKSPTDQIIEKEKVKSGGCRWLSAEEIRKDDDILPRIKFYALKALEALSD